MYIRQAAYLCYDEMNVMLTARILGAGFTGMRSYVFHQFCCGSRFDHPSWCLAISTFVVTLAHFYFLLLLLQAKRRAVLRPILRNHILFLNYLLRPPRFGRRVYCSPPDSGIQKRGRCANYGYRVLARISFGCLPALSLPDRGNPNLTALIFIQGIVVLKGGANGLHVITTFKPMASQALQPNIAIHSADYQSEMVL